MAQDEPCVMIAEVGKHLPLGSLRWKAEVALIEFTGSEGAGEKDNTFAPFPDRGEPWS